MFLLTLFGIIYEILPFLGDLEQSDLAIENGLKEIIDKIKYMEMQHVVMDRVRYIEMNVSDVKRSAVVSQILEIYNF